MHFVKNDKNNFNKVHSLALYIYIYINTHTHTYIYIYTHTHTHTHRVSQEERAKLREGVPYVKLYRYNPKHLYPKLNGFRDNGK